MNTVQLTPEQRLAVYEKALNEYSGGPLCYRIIEVFYVLYREQSISYIYTDQTLYDIFHEFEKQRPDDKKYSGLWWAHGDILSRRAALERCIAEVKQLINSKTNE